MPGRLQSICGHGILSRSFFEVPDTQADTRFSDNPLLQTLGVRFYGGTQLIGAQGRVLGMLCVLDPEPQLLSDTQKTQLTTLAIQVMELLEAHRQRRRMQWLGAMISQVADEIYLFDLSTQVLLYANEAATQQGAAEVGETGLDEVTPVLHPHELARHIERLKMDATEVVYDTWVLRAQGPTPVEARWQRLKGPGHTLAMCTLRDATQRQQLERKRPGTPH